MESQPSLLKRYSHNEHATVNYRMCVLFCLCRIPVDFYPRTRHAMEYLHVWIHQQRGKKTKQNKRPTHNTHTYTHTPQNEIVLLCFAFSVTQIAVIISLALQAFSFILKAVFGIALHLTQFNK